MKNESSTLTWDTLEKVIGELEEFQKNKLIKTGRKIVPGLMMEDLLQPNDFPDLENSPYFRYEEGIHAGILTVQTALRCLRQEFTLKGNLQ